ncbi:hypothetical protein PR048_027279 [Dryococelus australis]|uniref:PiggyBac transposable element-derived protein domain-containing protein n=1 Tax=Dryococelus australis TaxID=614101 RepID=A0ABQ9GFH2_9NEOP|nr:hypothetical protein PR048_027279 [Dryococelus australis]
MPSKPKNLDEIDSVSDGEGSQVSDASTENSVHQTDSEISVSSSENEDESSTDNDLQFRRNKRVLLGRNNYNWSKIHPATSRMRAHNLVTKLSGLAGDATGYNEQKLDFLFLLAALRFDGTSARDERKQTDDPLAGNFATGKRRNHIQINCLFPTLTVLSLIEPTVNSNSKITANDWFSSIELVEPLKLKELTYVGTVRKNKRQIPPTFLPKKDRPLHSTEFAFTKDKNSFVLRSKKEHYDKKPEIIDFCNFTKAGVYALDQKCATYTVGRRTRRWTLAIWFAIIDIAAVNAHVVLGATEDSDNITRRDFVVRSLGRDQIKDYLASRYAIKNLQRERAACNYFKNSWYCKRCLFLRTLQEDVDAPSALGSRIRNIQPTVPSVAEEFANPIVFRTSHVTTMRTAECRKLGQVTADIVNSANWKTL